MATAKNNKKGKKINDTTKKTTKSSANTTKKVTTSNKPKEVVLTNHHMCCSLSLTEIVIPLLVFSFQEIIPYFQIFVYFCFYHVLLHTINLLLFHINLLF